MKILAIVVLIVFYAAYFAKMVIQSRKGIRTDQLGKSVSPGLRVQEILLKTVTLLVPVVEVASLLYVRPWFPLWSRMAGMLLCVIGDIVFITAIVEMKDNWRAGIAEQDKTDLVTTGIYAYSRNPAFLAFDLLYAGWTMMFFNWALFVVSLLGIFMFHLQILREEAFLELAFGENYVQYKRHVRRYFGRF